MNFFLTHIITWQTAVGILLAVLSFLPIRAAYKELRFDRSKENSGAITEAFTSTLLLGLALGFLPPLVIALPVQWGVLAYRHLMSVRAFWASMTAAVVYAIYYGLAVWQLGMENILFTWYNI